MSLSSRLEQDFVRAYKTKDTLRVAVLRMVKAAAKNKQVELGRQPGEDEVLAILGKEAKKRQESIDLYRKAGRIDLADKETQELAILQEYLPKFLSEKELVLIVEAAVARLDAKSLQDMGRVMQDVMNEHKGQVDGKLLSGLVRSRLSDKRS